MKLTLAITHYNRFDLLKECFTDLPDIVDEVLIQDDCSRPDEIEKLLNHNFARPVKIRVNVKNIGMSLNKAQAIENGSNNWVIIFDSDNVIDQNYFDSIPKILDPNVIYCPDFAKPEFDYTQLSGIRYSKNRVKELIKIKGFEAHLNTCNYLVNRKKYLEVYQHNPEMKGTDTIWFAYLWLKEGYSFEIVPGMQYFHRVHKESGFLKDMKYNMKQAEKVKKLILSL